MKQPIVSRSPDVMGGTPVFFGTRVPVQTLLDYLEAGESIDDFLEGFPSVTRDHVIAFLEEAKTLGIRPRVAKRGRGTARVSAWWRGPWALPHASTGENHRESTPPPPRADRARSTIVEQTTPPRARKTGVPPSASNWTLCNRLLLREGETCYRDRWNEPRYGRSPVAR